MQHVTDERMRSSKIPAISEWKFQNCEFRIEEDGLPHWEDEESCVDLSARKPANYLVQGSFPDHE